MYEELAELCEVLGDELREATDKLRGGKLNGSDLEYIDKLTHALKSVTILKEMEGGSYNGSYNGSYEDGMSGRRGRSYERSSRRRDSRGRYSRDEDIMSGLEELANSTPDPQTKAEIKKFMRTMGA